MVLISLNNNNVTNGYRSSVVFYKLPRDGTGLSLFLRPAIPRVPIKAIELQIYFSFRLLGPSAQLHSNCAEYPLSGEESVMDDKGCEGGEREGPAD